jgi:hypothetical protein
MDTTKQKYVRLKNYDSFIFFPQIIEHSTFSHLNPISAGFCYLNDDNVVKCFGRSISLGIDSRIEDTELATKQVYGIDAMLSLKL